MSQNYLKQSAIGALVLCISLTTLYLANEAIEKNTLSPETKPLQNQATSNSEKLNKDSLNSEKITSTEKSDNRYQGEVDTSSIPVSLNMQEYFQQSLYGALPLALKGTRIPPLYLDANGELIKDKSAKEFFEYFISGAREEGIQTTLGRLQEYFSMVLEEPAYQQAVDLLDNYMSYRYQLDSVASREDIAAYGNDKITGLKETLAKRRALRRETLGEEAALAMFGDSEAYEEYAVNMMQTNQDDTLTQAEKNVLFIQHEAGLPGHIKERIQNDRKERDLESKINELKRQDKQLEIYALRKSLHGEKYAETWAFMENKSDEWLARVSSFKHSKENILASTMLTDEYKREQVEALRNQTFTEEEKLKMDWQALQ